MNNVPEVYISYIRCMEDNYMVALHFIWGGSIIVFICFVFGLSAVNLHIAWI